MLEIPYFFACYYSLLAQKDTSPVSAIARALSPKSLRSGITFSPDLKYNIYHLPGPSLV